MGQRPGRRRGARDRAARRELWEGIGARVPDLGFRACGSLTPLRAELETAVAEAAVARPDAAARGYKLLTADEARAVNPALRGDFTAALWCERDAAAEPRTAQLALKRELLKSGRYTFLGGREVREVVGTASVRDDHGDVHTGDAVILATGAWLGGLVRELAGPDLPVRRVRLQMMQTDPLGEPLTTSVADADSFRYYPAYRGGALDTLNAEQAPAPTAAAHRMQLLMVQRRDGGLTIGDTHDEYEHPSPSTPSRSRTSTSPGSSSPSSAARCRGSATAGPGSTPSAPTPAGSSTASRCGTASGWSPGRVGGA